MEVLGTTLPTFREYDMLNVDWMEYGIQEEKKARILSFAGQFRKFALDLLDAPYVWGSENMLGTDCSGSVCFPLLCMGYRIRTTAHELMEKIFDDVPSDETSSEKVMAVFYVTNRDVMHGDRKVKKGTAIHVTPVVGKYVVLNAGNPVRLYTAKQIRLWYEERDCTAVWRELNKENLVYHSEEGDMLWGVDKKVMQVLKKV